MKTQKVHLNVLYITNLLALIMQIQKIIRKKNNFKSIGFKIIAFLVKEYATSYNKSHKKGFYTNCVDINTISLIAQSHVFS